MVTKVIQQLASNSPAHPALTIVNLSSGVDCTYTRSELWGEIEKARSLFQSAGLLPGTVVPIIQDSSIELWASFFGAMEAGLIPTIMAVPNFKTHLPTYARNLKTLFERYGFGTIATSEATFKKIQPHLEEIAPHLTWINLETLNTQPVLPPLIKDSMSDESFAFIQHSSGSTGVQKGVGISHAQTQTHIEAYRKSIDLRHSDVIVSWLPLYHDMGLIACCLLPLLTGTHVITLSAQEWVRNPLSLWEKVDTYKGSLVWLPNFAFSMLAERYQTSGDTKYDLSSLRMLINCSEPVRSASHEKFYESYKETRLSKVALSTCYAMAENVFAVTQTPPNKTPRVMNVQTTSLQLGQTVLSTTETGSKTTTVMSSGKTIENVTLKIVDQNRVPLPARTVGEIAIAGPSRFGGYYQNDELNKKVFDSAGFYLTGDVGFVDDDWIYVTGRTKDLIILAGRNFYPTDIEELVGEIPGIKKGRVVAFGLFNENTGTEELTVLAESENHTDPKETSRVSIQARSALMTKLDCQLHRLVLLAPGELVKTSSGKVARNDNKIRFQNHVPANT